MKRFNDTLSLSIADLRTYRPPATPDALGCPPASAPALTWQEHARIAADRLRLTTARLGHLLGRFWAMGVTAQDIADRTQTVALPLTRTAPEPPNRTPWSDALKVVVMLAVVLVLAIAVGVPTTPPVAAANPHPCAAYHWPHQAPAALHCAVLKAPKGK